ncbi:replication protein, partial [Lactiplantibacillus plantarum]
NKDSHHLAKPNYDPSSQPYKIASHLLTRIKQRQPDFKDPNLQKWANDIRLAHERDHRDYEKLDWLVDWSQDSSFWQANILSAGKLRKQYDTLMGQAERDHPTNVAPQTREDWFG